MQKADPAMQMTVWPSFGMVRYCRIAAGVRAATHLLWHSLRLRGVLDGKLDV